MATRDFTKAQFYSALERNGFSRPVLGCWVEDRQHGTGVSYGLVVGEKGLLRRASLAHVIKCRASEIAKRKAA